MKGAGADHEVDLPGRHEDEVEEVEDEVGGDHGQTDDHLGPLRLDDVPRPQSEAEEDGGGNCQAKW